MKSTKIIDHAVLSLKQIVEQLLRVTHFRLLHTDIASCDAIYNNYDLLSTTVIAQNNRITLSSNCG